MRSLSELLGRLNEALDKWLGGMFDVELGNLDDGPDPAGLADLLVPSFGQVSYFDFDDYPLTPVRMIPAPPDDSEHW